MVVLAQEESRELRHNYIGTEHILLGLSREEEGLAARVLESLEITLERVRAQVLRIVGSGEEVTSRQIPFTSRAKNVLELALHEASTLGHDHVDTEHVLLGLVRENRGVAARILLEFDADADKVRVEVMRILLAPGSDHPQLPGSEVAAGAELAPVLEELPGPEIGVELGWRGRPIALAALGAAVLARSAFDRAKTGPLEPLEMQLLASLTLGPADGPPTDAGELFESLTTALACDRDDLHDAVRGMRDQRLIVSRTEQNGDERVLITAAGVRRVDDWLRRTVSLFDRWPPDHPAADDATD